MDRHIERQLLEWAPVGRELHHGAEVQLGLDGARCSWAARAAARPCVLLLLLLLLLLLRSVELLLYRASQLGP